MGWPVSIPVSICHVTSSAVAVEAKPYVNREPEQIARVVAGDRQAARELYDAHAPRVFRLAFRLTGDEELARELTQETFIRAFAQLGRFRGESALSTWLHRVTVSVVSNAMRKVKRFRAGTYLDEGNACPRTPYADPDLRDNLHRAIDELPRLSSRAIMIECTRTRKRERPRSGRDLRRLSVRGPRFEKLAPVREGWVE